MLIGEILSDAATHAPEKTAIRMGGFEQSFAALDRAANRVANALIRAGYGKGRNVAILSPNRPEYAAIHFGAARSGAVLAHMSTRASDGEIGRILAATDIEALFVDASLAGESVGLRGDAPELERIVVIGGAAPGGMERYEDFLSGTSDDPPRVAVAPDDPCVITFTGGTTGLPKGVVASQEARAIGSVRARREFELKDDDVFCCSTPLFHIAGLLVWFQTGVLNRNTQVLMPAWDAEEFMRLVEEEGVTAAFLVPTQINAVIGHPRFSADRLKRWRYCNFGGAPMPNALAERMMAALPHLEWVEQYGQSETGNLTVRPPRFARSKMGSAGRAFSDVDIAILDDRDRPLPPGEIGELVTRGTHRMIGYYNDPDATAEVVTADGWVRTGDIGYLDGDGFLFLVDRSKDMIVSGGENIYPTEIEEALCRHPAVNECAVFGIPDERWGEVPAAHVVLQADAGTEEEELIAFVADRVARHKRPRRIRFVDAMPRTPVGKIQKNLIRAPYWEGRERVI